VKEWSEYGARSEKTGDSTWKMWHTMPEGEKRQIEETYTGPSIEEQQKDRRYPFKATFNWHLDDPAKNVQRDYKIIYRYDKLEDKWVKE
jgi:hypothetical protein